MTLDDLALLKASTDKLLKIETESGEELTARILWVFDGEDNADLFYELVSTTKPDLYTHRREAGGYSLPLSEIVSVKPIPVP